MTLDMEKTCVLIFNMQLEIIPLLAEGTTLLNNCVWLADLTSRLQVPLIVIEHKKLGKGSVSLKEVASQATYYEKIQFDCTNEDEINQAIKNTNASQFVLAGGESHVCILQSALGLMQMGKDVFVLEDTISARNENDCLVAKNRMENLGVHLITREMLFFELIKNSEFKSYQNIATTFLDGRYIR